MKGYSPWKIILESSGIVRAASLRARVLRFCVRRFCVLTGILRAGPFRDVVLAVHIFGVGGHKTGIARDWTPSEIADSASRLSGTHAGWNSCQ